MKPLSSKIFHDRLYVIFLQSGKTAAQPTKVNEWGPSLVLTSAQKCTPGTTRYGTAEQFVLHVGVPVLLALQFTVHA